MTSTISPAQPDVERVFRALADPTRRRVIERLGTRPISTSELASEFDMALPSFLEHLRLLEECALVTSSKRGRVRTYRLTPEPLEAAADWLARRCALWEWRLDQLDEHLATLNDKDVT